MQVTNQGGVPSSGVSAVVMNVTVTNPTVASHVTVWPSGATLPIASNLNFAAGDTVPVGGRLAVVGVVVGGLLAALLLDAPGCGGVAGDVVAASLRAVHLDLGLLP